MPSNTSSTHSFEVYIRDLGTVTVAAIHGIVDTATADDLLRTLRDVIAGGRVCLVGDLRGVRVTSGGGLYALLGALEEVRNQGGDLRLAAARGKVHEALRCCGFTNIPRLYEDVDAAIASFADYRMYAA